MANRLPAVIIDNGTGYTKMGYAGNNVPSYIIPSVIGTKDAAGKAQQKKRR
jgi:actin-related protein 3